MWHIKKIDPADLVIDIRYSAFVGAGGKTSLIEYLAEKTAKRNILIGILLLFITELLKIILFLKRN